MIAKLFEAFFGCKHSNYSFPITVRPRLAAEFRSLVDRNLCRMSGLRQRISLRLAGHESNHLETGENHAVHALAHKGAA